MSKIANSVKCSTCTGLRELSINNTALTDGNLDSISSCLKHNRTIQYLTMVHTKINNNVVVIAEAIQINQTLLVLDVSYNEITYIGAIAIGDALKHNNQLQELNISYNNVTHKGVVYLAECIKVNTTLIEMKMMQCCKPARNVKPNSYHNETTHLSDSTNSEARTALLVAMTCNQLRQKVTIENTNLFDEEVMIIRDTLQSNTILQDFTLSHCKLLEGQSAVFCVCVAHEVKEGYLDFFSKFDLLDECEEIEIDEFIDVHTVDKILIISKRLSNILEFTKKNKTLRTLVITQCAIGDEGAAIISDCIAKNTSIRELDLSHNLIYNKGAIRIFKSIEVNSVLQSLNIYCNKLSDGGALAASECLKINSTLMKLNIAKNDIRDEMMEQ